ncbi:MAG: hypothetical protein D6E12_17995 [Desulfovibrio sp.]|nr:MAG: hypothetical protein D6E12_17995 [Desulfovibrio sp.]
MAALVVLVMGVAVAHGEEDYAYIDFVAAGHLSYNATATVGEVIEGYDFFSSVDWKQYPHLDRMVVEVTGFYDTGAALGALRDALLAQDPPGDTAFYGKSMNEFEQVTIIMYFTVDMEMTELNPPSTSGMVRCRGGGNRTFQPGGIEPVFANLPPPIENLYRQCYN